MTKNQIEYQKLMETKRSNRAQEGQKKNELAETSRHNVAYEDETKRHNIATESVSLKELGVHSRQADASMRQADAAVYNAETNRLHQRETARSNRVNESINMKHAAAAAQQAVNSNMMANAALKQADVAEQNAYINRDLADSRIALEQSQASRNESETELTNLEIKYRGQENIRDWVDTGSNVLNAGSKFVSTLLQGATSVVKLVGG